MEKVATTARWLCYNNSKPITEASKRERKQTVKFSRVVASCAVMVSVMGAVIAVPFVASAQNYGGGNVQGYAAETPLDTGTIVQLTGKDSNTVKKASQKEVATDVWRGGRPQSAASDDYQ